MHEELMARATHTAAQLPSPVHTEEVVPHQIGGTAMTQAPDGLWWRRIGSRWVCDADGATQPPHGNTASSASTVPRGMWACHACTLHNENRNATCELCGAAAQPTVEEPSAGGGDCSPTSVPMPWHQMYTDGLTLAQRNARIKAVRRWEKHGTETKQQSPLMV